MNATAKSNPGNHVVLCKQIEVVQVSSEETYFSVVTESHTIFFSPAFVGRMRCGSKIIESKTAQPVAAVLNKGFPLIVESPTASPMWIVHVHNEELFRLAGDGGVMSFYKLQTGQDFLFASLVDQMMNGGVPDALVEALLRNLPKQMDPSADLPACGNRRLAERLRQRILETEDKQINLQHVAEELSCHPSQLSREFRRQFGIAPYRFSFLLRLAKTREWLRRGQNLADVALNFEFSDQSHFTRAFRETYQVTPNHYRNLYREQWEIAN